MGIVRVVFLWGDCIWWQVGVVIFDCQYWIIGVGYNGMMLGGLSCLMGDCFCGRYCRVFSVDFFGFIELCLCGVLWFCFSVVVFGLLYDIGLGVCIVSYVEQLVLVDVEVRYWLSGVFMYVIEELCDGCLKQIKNMIEIVEIVWLERVIWLR